MITFMLLKVYYVVVLDLKCSILIVILGVSNVGIFALNNKSEYDQEMPDRSQTAKVTEHR